MMPDISHNAELPSFLLMKGIKYLIRLSEPGLKTKFILRIIRVSLSSIPFIPQINPRTWFTYARLNQNNPFARTAQVAKYSHVIC